LCNFLHSPVASSLLGSNIPLRTLFSNILSLCKLSLWITKLCHNNYVHEHNKSVLKLCIRFKKFNLTFMQIGRTLYGLDDLNSLPEGGRISLLATMSKPRTVSHPVVTPGTEWSIRETYHSLPFGVKVNKMPSFTSIPPIHFHGIMLIH
jgi:hypothetical protein